MTASPPPNPPLPSLPAFPEPLDSLAEFGRLVRARRQARHLTLDQLAHLTRISKPYLSNIETARAPGPASDEKLARLEVALQFPAGHLVGLAAWLRTPASIRAWLREVAPRAGVAGQSLAPRLPNLPRRADGSVNLDALLAQVGVGETGKAAGSSVGAPPTLAESKNADAVRSRPGAKVRMVPLINRVAAGPATEFTDLDYPAGIADDYVPAIDPAALLPPSEGAGAPAMGPTGGMVGTGGMFAVRVAGDSMFPDFIDGEIVIVGAPSGESYAPWSSQPGAHAVAGAEAQGQAAAAVPSAAEIANGAVCLVRLDAAENFAQTLKRVYFEDPAVVGVAPADRAGDVPEGAGGLIHLTPINPAYPTRRVPREQITGLYPVLWKLIPMRK